MSAKHTPEPRFEVHWCKHWDDRAICDPTTCRHEPDRLLTIGLDLRPRKRSGHDIHLAGHVCMDCGLDTTGQLDRVQALEAAWNEHGWNRDLGCRLYAIAERHREFFMQQTSVTRSEKSALDEAYEIERAIKRHVAPYHRDATNVSVTFDTRGVCEYCGEVWTEKNETSNGGCCDKDQDAEEKRVDGEITP